MTIGSMVRFDLKYNFEIYMTGVPGSEAAFSTCSELSATVGEAVLWQGGSLIPIKEPTRLTFADVTLERGSSRSTALWDWFTLCSNATVAGGLAGVGNGGSSASEIKKHITINQKDRRGNPLEFIFLYWAWPKEISLGDWSNDSDEFRIEKIVLSYDYFTRSNQAQG